MRLAGIDYSITSPAICIFNGTGVFQHKDCEFFSRSAYDIKNFENFNFSKHRPYGCEMERFHDLSDWALDITDGCDAVALEDYAMRAKGRVFAIGENTGILKYNLWQMQCEGRIGEILPVAPTAAKKVAGIGKCPKGTSKDAMYIAWLNKTGIDLKMIIQNTRKLGSPTTDIVDSYFICQWLLQNLAKLSKTTD